MNHGSTVRRVVGWLLDAIAVLVVLHLASSAAASSPLLSSISALW